MTEEATTHTHEFSEPTYTRRLVELVETHDQAGSLIGVSGGLIGKALKQNRIRTVNDLAAKAVLQDLEPAKSGRLDTSAEFRRALNVVSRYLAKTPAIDMPSDIFALVNQPLGEIARNYTKKATA